MKKLLLFIALTIFGLGLNAQSITIDYGGYSLKLEITSVSPAECEVSDYTGEPVDVTIPSTVTVSGIEFAVTSIGDYAFNYCSSLTSIEIPNSVTSIGEEAFYDCSSLTSIEIPNSVTSIGYGAFSRCSSLTSVTFGENSQLISIGKNAFYRCSSLTSIEIPNSVTSIGYGAFQACESLTSVVVAEGNTVYDSRDNCNAIIETSSNTLIAGCQNTVIPNSVTSIGDNAFHECESLTSIEIPNSVTSIGYRAFYECESLTSIEIPNSVTSIGDWAFYYCSSLTSIVVAEGNTVYDSRDNCNAIIETSSNKLIAGCQNTIIPNSVTSIEDDAFSGCSSLTSIEIPNSVASIGDWAFSYCSSLTSITFGENSQLTSIGYWAFEYCSSLTSITFGENSQLTSIGYEAFQYCSSLTSIEIPNSVTSIGEKAFWECSSLRVIKCHAENVPETGDNYVFNDCPSDMTIYVPEVSLEDYKATSPWNKFIILSLVAVCPAEVTLDVKAMPNEVTITATPNEHAVEFHFGLVTKASFEEKGLENLIQEIRNDGHPAFEQTSATWVNGIVPGGEYVALGSAKNSLNEWGETTIVHFTTPLEDDTPDPLDAPENLEAKATSTSSISLSWDEVKDAESYNIYRDNELLNNVGTTAYTDNNLEANTTYCYTVTAVRGNEESEFSDEDCATTLKSDDGSDDGNDDGNDDGSDNPTDTIVPEPEVLAIPENLVAKAESSSSISLSWDEVENAESYNVYRDGDSIANVANPTYTDKDLEYNTEYCYTVTAVGDDDVESEESEEVCAKTLGESLEELSSSINIYPNPVENELFLATEVRVEEIAIYDVYGRQTMSQQVNETTSQQVVEVADLEAGIYFVNVKTENGNVVKRFVKN